MYNSLNLSPAESNIRKKVCKENSIKQHLMVRFL